MCLNTVRRNYANPSTKLIFAYKVFEVFRVMDTSRKSHLEFGFPWKGFGNVQTDVWLTPNSNTVIYAAQGYFIYFNQQYRSGFHSFATKKEADHYASDNSQLEVRKVVISQITARGFEHYDNKKLNAYVSQRLYIPSDEGVKLEDVPRYSN